MNAFWAWMICGASCWEAGVIATKVFDYGWSPWFFVVVTALLVIGSGAFRWGRDDG